MSKTTSEPGGSQNFPACLGLDVDGRPSLVLLCNHVVNWADSFDSTVNRLNYAEAHSTSECDVAAATEDEMGALLEIIALAEMITDMHAANQIEIEAKQRALNALTGIPAWERDSLFAMRRSIERDQLEVNALLVPVSPPSPQPMGWLGRLNLGVAKG